MYNSSDLLLVSSSVHIQLDRTADMILCNKMLYTQYGEQCCILCSVFDSLGLEPVQLKMNRVGEMVCHWPLELQQYNRKYLKSNYFFYENIMA